MLLTQQDPGLKEPSALLDLELAHLTQHKMAQESRKQKHDLCRMVALCNTLDIYTLRLRTLHPAFRPTTRTPPTTDSCDAINTTNECHPSSTSSNYASDHSDSEEEYEDTTSPVFDRISGKQSSVACIEQLTVSRNQQSNHIQWNMPVDNKTQQLSREMESEDEDTMEYCEHNNDDQMSGKGTSIPFNDISSSLTNCLKTRSVPRELYRIVDLIF
jgi:hypothetical protein